MTRRDPNRCFGCVGEEKYGVEGPRASRNKMREAHAACTGQLRPRAGGQAAHIKIPAAQGIHKQYRSNVVLQVAATRAVVLGFNYSRKSYH
jgi:hypothetical protein